MSENMSQTEQLKEAFNTATEDGLPDDDNLNDGLDDGAVDALPDEPVYDHTPTDDDDEDYVKGFAKSKGWSDDPSKAKPGYFTDYRAFISKYDTMQEAKLSKSDVADMKKLLEETAKQTGEVTRLQREQSDQRYNEIKAQLEAAKADAREALDFEANDAADAALKKLEETNAKEEEKAPATEPDIFLNFRAENPLVDHNSPDFNAELNTRVELAVNAALRSGTITTEYQLMKVMDKALDDATPKAKEMPKAPATNRASGASTGAKLDPSRLDAASRGMYDFYIKKGLDSVAKDFLKSSLGA